jgi:hypothetical protein
MDTLAAAVNQISNGKYTLVNGLIMANNTTKDGTLELTVPDMQNAAV